MVPTVTDNSAESSRTVSPRHALVLVVLGVVIAGGVALAENADTARNPWEESTITVTINNTVDQNDYEPLTRAAIEYWNNRLSELGYNGRFEFERDAADSADVIVRVVDDVGGSANGRAPVTDGVGTAPTPTVIRVEWDGESFAPAAVEEAAIDVGAAIARVTDHREIEDEAETPDVSFADPDEAVREQVREAGLSPAGADLDQTVRATDVADSNVRDRVERRVRERIDEGLEVFEGAADDEANGAAGETESETESEADNFDDAAVADNAADPTAADEPDDSDDSQVTMEDFS